jgi:hypothetical protein
MKAKFKKLQIWYHIWQKVTILKAVDYQFFGDLRYDQLDIESSHCQEIEWKVVPIKKKVSFSFNLKIIM